MKEFADRSLRTTSKISTSDRRRYKGVAVVPAARAWLLDKWQSLNQRATDGSTAKQRLLARKEADLLFGEMKTLGMLGDK